LAICFDRDRNLGVRVNMTGAHHEFRTGKQGYLFRESFDWDGRRWLVKFQAFVMPHRVDSTLGLLDDAVGTEKLAFITEPDLTSAPGSLRLTGKLKELVHFSMERQDKLRAGWHLRRSEVGVEGSFQLARIRPLPHGKLGSFASFNVELNGRLYLGQFHISEHKASSPRPTAWDHSRGAKAGLPSLGKRR
jgi:hypothetical protein